MNRRNLPVRSAGSGNALTAQALPQAYVDPIISPRQIWSILWAHRWKTVLIAASVIAMVGAATMVLPRTYEATATLMVNFDVYDPMSGREFPIGLVGSYMATQVELARSTEVVLPVVERLGLTDNEQYTDGYNGPPEDLKLWVADRVRKKLQVNQGLYGSQLIYVKFSAKTAEHAALVANTVADVYTQQQYRRLTEPAQDRAERYTAQLDELKGKVNTAQDEATNFRRRHDLIDSDMTGDVSLELLTQLEHRLQEIQQVRRVAEAKAAGDASVGDEVLNSTMIQSLKSQLAAYNAQMGDLTKSLGARHPDVRALRSQIDSARQALYAEQQAYQGNVTAQLASAKKLEAQLQAAVVEQREKVANIRDIQDDGAEYQLELESAEEVYQRALEGYDQVMLSATGDYNNVELVSRATPPAQPSQPRVALLFFLGCIAGVGLGFILPLGYELLHRRIRSREDIERDHGIPVLAELGRFDGRGRNFALGHEG